MGRVVQKFGGSSVADAASIKRVAKRVAATKAEGTDVVVVISAMGDTTDELMDLALEVSPQPAPRELDMLLTTGERQSAALLAMGCHLCRTCQSGKCNWGIATQRPELVKRLNPDVAAPKLVNLLTAWNHEIEELMGGMGINSIEALKGNRLMLRGVGLTEKELSILGIAHAGE